MQIAKKVKKIVTKKFKYKKIDIEVQKSHDNRSYHINSSKIYRQLKFKPKKNIEDAINELCLALKQNKFKNSMSNDIYYNVRTLLKKKVY